jgi:hypothetical protein
MLAPVDPATKEKVVKAFLTGHGINRITRDLHEQGIKVSHGSVCKIVKKYKHDHQQQSSQLQPQEQTLQQQEDNTTINTPTPLISITGTPSLNTSASLSPHEAVPPQFGGGLEPAKSSGNPLQRFLNEISTAEALGDKEVTSTSPLITETLHEPIFDSDVSESTESELKQINDINNVSTHLNVIEEDAPLEEEAQEQCKLKQSEHHKPESPIKISVAEDSPRTSEDRETETPTPGETVEDSEIEDSLSRWNSDAFIQKRILSKIVYEKRQRREELALIDQKLQQLNTREQELNIEKQNLVQFRQNLENKEAEIERYKDLLPSTKQLRDMGLDFVELFIWIEAIKNKAAEYGIDEKAAASLVLQELKTYEKSGGIEKAVQEAQQNLAALNEQLKESQQSLESLHHLKKNNVSDVDLIELKNLMESWGSNRTNRTGNGSNNLFKLDDKLRLRKLDANN